MDFLTTTTQTILNGQTIGKEEAMALYQQPLEPLCNAADTIRRHFCSNRFDLCAIINGKSGRCSENCKYCAQAACYQTEVDTYPLLPTQTILADAQNHQQQGVPRYSIVTSGKRLSNVEVDQMCATIQTLRRQTNLHICVSFGLLDQPAFQRLKEAGVSRIHNNLETSRRNFPNVCTSHSFEDKIAAIRAAQAAGLEVCSGGIMGLGETPSDRVDLALELRELGINSVPINVLNPITGTPYQHNPRLTNEELRRIVAVFRFILPKAWLRLAGGRGLLPDQGRGCFCSGANAAISGDMLTTSGISVAKDLAMLRQLGYRVVIQHG